jgi:hypothetical protein
MQDEVLFVKNLIIGEVIFKNGMSHNMHNYFWITVLILAIICNDDNKMVCDHSITIYFLVFYEGFNSLTLCNLSLFSDSFHLSSYFSIFALGSIFTELLNTVLWKKHSFELVDLLVLGRY